MPWYISSMASTENLLEIPNETVACVGLPFMAYVSLTLAVMALKPEMFKGHIAQIKCTPSSNKIGT
jgi:hypothetical protein